MKDRIKKIRKESSEKTLEKFGAKIGISAAALSQIENGKTEASKQTINTICDKFGVNEVWLRTGEGDVYAKMPEDDLIKLMKVSIKQNVFSKEFVCKLKGILDK